MKDIWHLLVLVGAFGLAYRIAGGSDAPGITVIDDKTVNTIHSIHSEVGESGDYTQEVAALRRNAKVTLLVTSWCGYCRSLESFLKENKINHRILDVESSPQGRRIYEKLGGGGVPVTLVDNHVIRGYQPDAILNLLSKPAPPASKVGV